MRDSIELNKENLNQFLEYYHYLHDSLITNINYDVLKAKAELLLNVHWLGEAKKSDDGYYETNKKKMKITFMGIEKINIKEFFQWDYISDVFIDYVKLENKEYICFSSDKEDPFFYIVCDSIQYQETKVEK